MIQGPVAGVNRSHDSRVGPYSLDSSLRVSSYDRVASLIISLLFVVGFAVTLLFLIWLTRRAMTVPESIPVQFLEAGGAEGQYGEDKGFEEPLLEEVEELIEPQLEETIDVITDVVSSNLSSLESLNTAGAGAGGDRDSGPGGTGDADVIPRWERWEIRYPASDKKAYGRQLDFFGIELAATGGGRNVIEYASNVSNRRPTRRTAPPDQEERVYMVWADSPLKQADREFLSAAGIETQGRILMQYLPPAVEQALASLEQEKAGKRSVTEIRRTVFGVKGSGDKYEYFVISQQYRFSR